MKRSTSRARSRPPKVQWVEQVDKGGCGLACLAMLLDTTYARIVEWGPELCGKCGMEDDQMEQFLASKGMAWQRVWQHREFDGKEHEPWPPEPWAERHLCSVVQTPLDMVGHFVVMDRDGACYDPADTELKPRRLTDYHEVEWVAGVFKVGDTR